MSGLGPSSVDWGIRAGVRDGVRDSMRRLGPAFAVPLTLLTGTPHTGQRPIRFTPTRHLVNATGSMLAGLAISAGALTGGRWWLLLLVPGWAATLHGTRNLRMMIYHQCAHRNMWARPRPDAVLGKVLAALLMVQEFERYSAEHVTDHHAVHHMTVRDPTVQAMLIGLGLRPGMSRRQMWRRLLGRLASPAFHASFLVSRIRSYVLHISAAERAGVLAALVGVAGLATVLHGWTFVLVAWVVPQTVLYQVSNTLRLCVKHSFPAPDQQTRRGRDYFAGLTNAIFLGEPVPAAGLPPLARAAGWGRWWSRMLLVHFPARYLVLTGDTVCHDFHHRHPMSRDWANYIFARAEEDGNGAPGWPPYRHVWGLVPAIDTVFASLSRADPAEYDVARVAGVRRRELFAAFDD